MNDKIIITIARQFGSGGREIGEKVAEKLGIKLYDKELIKARPREAHSTKVSPRQPMNHRQTVCYTPLLWDRTCSAQPCTSDTKCP